MKTGVVFLRDVEQRSVVSYFAKVTESGRKSGSRSTGTSAVDFQRLCDLVKEYVDDAISQENESDFGVSTARDAIMGVDKAVRYFIDKIRQYLRQNRIGSVLYPSWYDSLEEAIFQENWGFGCVCNWFKMDKSSSAKIIGERVYYMINGRMELQEQRLTPDRLEKLRANMLLCVPDKSKRDAYVELTMVNGTRITMFSNEYTKHDQDVIVFRKYIVEHLRFEEFAKRGTIPHDSVEFFKAFAQVGFNVLFAGQVRSGKTTFLECWQSYEDPSLEGLMLETTDEIQAHKLNPGAPIVQLITAGGTEEERMNEVVRSLLRSDADYLIMGEARTGVEFDLMVKMANKGTRRCKSTIHTTDIADIPYELAEEIMSMRPNGSIDNMIFKVAKSFHYVIQLMQLPDKAQKRLKGIYEFRADRKSGQIRVFQICKYVIEDDRWEFFDTIGDDKVEIGKEENFTMYLKFREELSRLAKLYPYEGNPEQIPYASRRYRGGE